MGLLKFSSPKNLSDTFLATFLGPLFVSALIFATGVVAQNIAGGPGDATDDCSLLDTQVQDALRKELEKDNCIRELEVCTQNYSE